MENPSRQGLVWKDSAIGPAEPSWSREPSIEAIEKVCREQLHIAEDASCTVSSYAAGSFNKLYLVEIPDHPTYPKSLMRVSLPVDPHHKTRGEVATLRWVQHNTDIPVPKVICWDDSNLNGIGFEWILMELMPGTTAYKLWRSMNMDQKTALVERVAEYQDQLLTASSRDNLRGIGTLRLDTEKTDKEKSIYSAPTPGRIVDRHFFWGDHIDYDIPRGPFKSTHDWLATHLNITIQENTAYLDDSDNDEEDVEWIDGIIRLARKLLDLLPKVFPSVVHPAEWTFPWHDDLNLNNILLDDDGNITAVLDWEFLSCQPFWVSTQMPDFLIQAPREKEPLREEYGDDDGTLVNRSGLDNEGKNELFWVHLMEYEATQLGKAYNARLEQLRPGWDLHCQDHSLRVDFLDATSQCAAGSFNCGWIERWVDIVEGGKTPDLQEMLRTRTVPVSDDSDSDDSDSDAIESDDSESGDARSDKSD